MKLKVTGAICSSLLLLTACNSISNSNQTAEAPAFEKTALASGVSKANMDLSVRPQDDFYLYVNGGWMARTEIPADKTSVGSFYDLRDSADDDVKTIIESLAATDNLAHGSDEQKVADLFRAYMDTESLNKLGVDAIKPLFDKINAVNSKDELASFFAKAQTMGIETPLAFYVSIDAKDSARYATHIWQSGLGLADRDYYFKDEERFVTMRADYQAHIAKMFELAGLKDGKAAGEMILALETKIAEHHWTRVQTRDSEKRYNKFDVANLSELTAHFNWQDYLAAQGVAAQKDIIINQPDFIKGFGEIFKSTSLNDWKTYLTWHALTSYASYMNAELDAENFDFYGKKLRGQTEQKARWKRGVSLSNAILGEVIGKVYVGKHFKPEAKERMSVLVENLRDAYGASIDNLEWMSADTKKAARVKLAAFTPKIGYPDKWEDYSKLEITGDDLIGNILRARKIGHEKDIERLGGPIRKWEWGMTPQTVNAYYSPTRNEIVFPAAILQPPFFNMAADDAVNYGGIGAVIGHEMGHGFDDQGSRYDAEGNLRNWWTEQDLEEFKKRTTDLVAQYAAYKVFDDLHVNGELTLGENIGDLSGVTIAYKAYKKSLNGEEAPVIDGLTGDQRFFMGYAQIWRVKMREKALRTRTETDPHSPGHFRAVGSLSNMSEFYEAFDLKEGDAMYIAPEKRVKIW